MYGAIRYTSDYDFFVYKSNSTKARTLRLGVNLEGPSDIIQEKIDELAPATGGAGWRYPLSIR